MASSRNFASAIRPASSPDSAESATRELGIFFGEASELCSWEPVQTPWVYNVAEELS